MNLSDLEIVKKNIPNFSSEKLCSMIACHRYLGVNEEIAIWSMEELSKRRQNGDSFPFEDFKDYLRTVPEVSPDLPQGLSGYFMQLQIPQEDLRAMLILNQAIIPPPTPKVVSVLLDIDLGREIELPDTEAAWDVLEQLHTRTDQVFEACITDRTRELID